MFKVLSMYNGEISYLKDKLGGINKSKYILHKEYKNKKYSPQRSTEKSSNEQPGHSGCFLEYLRHQAG